MCIKQYVVWLQVLPTFFIFRFIVQLPNEGIYIQSAFKRHLGYETPFILCGPALLRRMDFRWRSDCFPGFIPTQSYSSLKTVLFSRTGIGSASE